ncbi:hypothetical protein NDU88_007824 [Pleurodeles waltl]|uniref:Uncharacterized protein n=1 Tax=Pleurodeles waltl TaxID=8319 RepID=A0AAV7PV05_PLEWA|nr:hypothetical protein NDU88_007824 [Pleurodeles waltl]
MLGAAAGQSTALALQGLQGIFHPKRIVLRAGNAASRSEAGTFLKSFRRAGPLPALLRVQQWKWGTQCLIPGERHRSGASTILSLVPLPVPGTGQGSSADTASAVEVPNAAGAISQWPRCGLVISMAGGAAHRDRVPHTAPSLQRPFYNKEERSARAPPPEQPALSTHC